MSPARRSDLTVRLLAASCLVAAVLLSLVTGWDPVPWWGLPALTVAVAVTEVAVVHLNFGRERWTFSLTEAVLGGALVLAPGVWATIAGVLGLLAAQLVRRQLPIKLAFNVGQFALSMAVAQLVVHAIDPEGGVAPAAAAMAAFWVVNYLLVAVVVSVTTGGRLVTLIGRSALLSLAHTAGNTSIGLLAAYLAVAAPVGLLALVVPVALLWISYDQEARRSAEARLYRELAHGQEQAVTRSTDVSAQVVLTTAARIFGGADVEMVLLATDGPVRWVGDEHGLPRRSRVESDAFDEPWIIEALGGRGITTGTDGGRPYCTIVLASAQAPQAVLIARRSEGSGAFGRREVRLAEVLARQAEQWLSVSDLSARYEVVAEQAAAASGATRALGDIGAATAPALSVLRDSAGRLSRLADAGGVDDIVDELHLVERAVASLLGAVALAAEPELLTGAPEREAPALGLPQRATTDWTTTGVLR